MCIKDICFAAFQSVSMVAVVDVKPRCRFGCSGESLPSIIYQAKHPINTCFHKLNFTTCWSFVYQMRHVVWYVCVSWCNVVIICFCSVPFNILPVALVHRLPFCVLAPILCCIFYTLRNMAFIGGSLWHLCSKSLYIESQQVCGHRCTLHYGYSIYVVTVCYTTLWIGNMTCSSCICCGPGVIGVTSHVMMRV